LISRSIGHVNRSERSFEPVVTPDGRYVAFTSYGNLLAGTKVLCRGDDLWGFHWPERSSKTPRVCANIYVYDRRNRRLDRVSVSSAGTQANGDSDAPSISDDGRYVAFESTASNLVPHDTNGRCYSKQFDSPCLDVFVHDRRTGKTIRASLDGDARQFLDVTHHPMISGNGRFVVFELQQGRALYVRDLVQRTSTVANLDSKGQLIAGDALYPRISRDGRFVTFAGAATLHRKSGIFIRDMVAGRTERIGATPGWNDPTDGSFASISSDGRWVVFETRQIILAYDRFRKRMTHVTVAIDGGFPDDGSFAPAVSADGRFVVFASFADDLVHDDSNGDCPPVMPLYSASSYGCGADIFRRDLLRGTTVRVSVTSAGEEASAPSWGASISRDGSVIAFASTADNLSSGDDNPTWDMFVRVQGTVEACASGAREDGQLSSAIHSDVEPSLFTLVTPNRARPLVHKLSCDVAATNGL
jgi:Tol biopolymer transport system component